MVSGGDSVVVVVEEEDDEDVEEDELVELEELEDEEEDELDDVEEVEDVVVVVVVVEVSVMVPPVAGGALRDRFRGFTSLSRVFVRSPSLVFAVIWISIFRMLEGDEVTAPLSS